MIFGLFGKKKKEEEKVLIGEVVHYFRKVNVAVITVRKGELSVGDTIAIETHSDKFKQKIGSMEIDHKAVEKVSAGTEVAIKVKKKARPGSKIYALK